MLLTGKQIHGWLARLIVALLLLSFPAGVAWAESISATELQDHLAGICAEYAISDGAYWTVDSSETSSASCRGGNHSAEEAGWEIYPYAGETGSAAFAAFLGDRLFPKEIAFSGWAEVSTPPLVKAGGIRMGDIICAGDHAAMIFSVEEGEIRVIEADDLTGEIRINACFAGNDACKTLDQIVETCGFARYLRAPGNSSPILWSGRMAALPEEPAITGETYPTVLSNDQFFGLRGTVACRYPITRIRATVTNRVTGEIIFDVSVYPDANTYAIGNPTSETINDQLVFNSPECANSWLKYKLEATYQKGEKAITKVILDRNFKVGSPLTEEPD